MPVKEIYVDVNGRKLKLSNLDKIIYPEVPIIKAEMIQYYIDVAPILLRHIKNRPLTLIRFPDGVEGKRFYSKNKPSWTPKWIASTLFPGDEENQYVMANEEATIAWIGNLAGLEIHPMNVRSPQLEYPDQFIFDLDPSEEINFPALKKLALSLKKYLETHGYVPFIKTSGSKGLHIYVPIIPKYPQDVVFQSVKSLASEYVKNHGKTTTLKISKAKRKGKVLLDIYRNHKAQSCVAPYSLRGKSGAPISTPFPWKLLEELPNSQYWNIKNIQEHLKKYGDVWESFTDHAVHLHDDESIESDPKLEEYSKKRDFTKTKEPGIEETIQTPGNGYVVQLHDASNLHYDLRLEYDGTLHSWAIPKGLPDRKDIKRLAIRTEDHPLKYLTFEGVIPKKEYGGGEMWVFDSGTYDIIKKSEKKYHFHLKEGGLQGEYVLYNTKGQQWIIEKKNTTLPALHELKNPMLASAGKKMPGNKNYFYEIKWDGLRTTIVIVNGKLTIYSRNGNDITNKFPEIHSILEKVEAETAVMDGEIVSLDAKGAPEFHNVVGRIHLTGKTSIAKVSRSKPATLYLFDLMYLDGKDCRRTPVERRRSWLKTILTPSEIIRFSETFDDGDALLEATRAHGMEGIICKKKGSSYQNGVRSKDWLKIKNRTDDEAYIIGYTEGQGDRAGSIGALHLAKKKGNSWLYMGKVGTGFNQVTLKKLHKILVELNTIHKPIQVAIEEENRTIWKETDIVVELSYASLSSNGTYREPVFKKIKK